MKLTLRDVRELSQRKVMVGKEHLPLDVACRRVVEPLMKDDDLATDLEALDGASKRQLPWSPSSRLASRTLSPRTDRSTCGSPTSRAEIVVLAPEDDPPSSDNCMVVFG